MTYEVYSKCRGSKGDYDDYALLGETEDPYATLGDKEEDPYNLIPDLESELKNSDTYNLPKNFHSMTLPRDFVEYVRIQTGGKLKFSDASLEALDYEYRKAVRDVFENEYTALGKMHDDEKDANEEGYSNLDDVIAKIEKMSQKSLSNFSCKDDDGYDLSKDDNKSQDSQNRCPDVGGDLADDVGDDNKSETDSLIPMISIIKRPKLAIPKEESNDTNDDYAKVECRIPTPEHKKSSDSSISLHGSDQSLAGKAD